MPNLKEEVDKQNELLKSLEEKLNDYENQYKKSDEIYRKHRNKRAYLNRRIRIYSDRIYAIKQGQFEFRGT